MRHVILILSCLLLLGGQLIAQNNPTNRSFSTVNVDQLTTGQIRQLSTQLAATNLSQRELTQYLIAKGMSRENAGKLLSRIQELERTNRRATSTNTSQQDLQGGADADSIVNTYASQNRSDSTVFGASLFKDGDMSFAPALNIATPKNYIIGPGDELNLTVFGSQETDEQLTVSRDGKISLAYTGLVQLSGLSIEQATARLKQLMTKSGYSSLGNGQSQLILSLDNPRSIGITVVGAMKPGSYQLPAVATVMHALYAAGGPAKNGSYRNIKLVRSGKEVANLDLYYFITAGTLTGNLVLQENDVVVIPAYESRISIQGMVKRPGLFEWKSGETLQKLLSFAGGFADLAVTERVLISGLSDNRYYTADVLAADFESYQPKSGDMIRVMKSDPQPINRVIVNGAVMLPGIYAWEQGLSLQQLTQKFGGFRDEAVMSRALIFRQRRDQTKAYLRFRPDLILNKTEDVVLEDGDSIVVADKRQHTTLAVVEIRGEVMDPAVIDYGEGMTVGDLIFLAGGLRPTASTKKIEIARKVEDRVQIARVFETQTDLELEIKANDFELKPGDMVIVRPNPLFREHRVVELTGEFANPGPYNLLTRNEKLSDLIRRSGGLTPEADMNAGILIRRTLATFEKKNIKRKDDQAEEKLGMATNNGQESEKIEAENEGILELVEEIVSDTIALNLSDLMKGSEKYNLWIKQGDIIYVAPRNNTVAVRGAVNNPLTINFYNRKLKSYIRDAGGVTSTADRKRVYVIEPNGQSRATTSFLWMYKYPRVIPGSTVVIPEKNRQIQRERDPARAAAIASIAASTAGVLITIIAITR